MGEAAHYPFRLGDRATTLDTTQASVLWTHDALGRRVSETVCGAAGAVVSKTLYVWDGWRLVAELDARENNRVVAEYVPGPGYVDETVAVRRDLNRDGDFADTNEGFLYPLADQQHSTVALLNASGSVVERYGYDAFGTPSFYDGAGNALAGGSAVGNTTLYTGRTWLPELGLYDYRQRLYDPTTGRFLTPDPAQDPANLGNPYTYTANNPHAFVDPYGEWGWDNDWVQTGLEIFGAGCLTGRGGAARSFWMDSGGEQLRGMAQGAGVILGGDLGTAYEGMVAEAAASYETRIALHSATNGGDVNAAIATATGWRMVGADLVGFTGLAEAGSGMDYTTGGILEGQERLQRGLVGGSQLAGTVAMVGSTLSRGYAVAARGVVARTAAVGAPAVDTAGQIAEVHQVLTQAAGRALRAVGPGKGHVWGTKVHGAFSTEVKQLQRPELLSERSFRVGERADYGVKGSVRVDVLYGTMENPIAVYDLKLNTSRLSARRIAQIQSHLPGTAAIPVIEVRP